MQTAVNDPGDGRLDNFVDAAFAFALTLLVIAGAEPSFDYSDLIEGIKRVPAFGAGFALIGLFWFAHVSWRRAGGRNDNLSVVLSLALVFAVLIYVYPLRLMVFAFVGFLAGQDPMAGSPPGGLFTIYGLGFAAMAGLVWGLYAHSRRLGQLSLKYDDAPAVWATLALTGVASALLAQFHATMLFAPWTYCLLPVTIPLILYSRQRRGKQSRSEEAI